MISIKSLVFLLPFLNIALAKPGYGSYNYDGHGHSGYNSVGTNYKVQDYYSKPQYAFGYEVDDYYSQLSHGRWEVRDGDVTQGQYRVLLPDGRLQIVSYIADKGGYRPTIQYIGKGVHPPPPPPYAKIKPPKHIPDPYLQHDLQHNLQNNLNFQPSGPPIQPLAPFQPAYGEGPFKLDLNPSAIGPLPGFKRNRFLGHQAGGHGVNDLLYYGPSSKREVKLSPDKISRRRALLYDRTLFRRDIPKPPTKPR